MHAEQQEQSYIGRFGHFIEPIIRPLGFDWQIGVSLTSGLAAKEIVVSTLGVLYAGEETPAATTVAGSGDDTVVAADAETAAGNQHCEHIRRKTLFQPQLSFVDFGIIRRVDRKTRFHQLFFPETFFEHLLFGADMRQKHIVHADAVFPVGMRIKVREKRIQRNIPVDSVFSAQSVHHGSGIAVGAYYKIGFEFGNFFFDVF